MEQNILSNNETRRQFRNLTSQHIRQYWNITSQQYPTPFYIGRVVTSVLSETRSTIQSPNEPFLVNSVMIQPIPLMTDNLTNLTTANTSESNNIVTLPDRLDIVYTQEITYLELSTGDASFFNFQVSDIFTIPFVQDGLTYTTTLRSITLNKYIIFLDYTGVVVEEAPKGPVLSDPKNRNLIISVATVVVIVLLAASLYIYCLIQRRPKIAHDLGQQHWDGNVGSTSVDDRNGPELLLQMNENGELPLLMSPPSSTAAPTLVLETQQQQQNDINHSASSNHKENVIVSECYDEEYHLPDVATTNPPITEEQRQNVATEINQPLLPPFLPPLSAMDSRHISNITEPTSWGSEQNNVVPRTTSMLISSKNHTMMDRGSPLRIAASRSQEFDSEPFMLNPTNTNNELTYHLQHQPLMIGTPSRYGMVTTAVPSTVSDLDMNETPLMSDFQDSPLPTFRHHGEENHYMHNGGTGGYEGYGDSTHNNNNNNNLDPDYTQPPSPLLMGLSIPGNGIDDHMLDQHHHPQQEHHYYHHYPHEPDSHMLQQHEDVIYSNNSASSYEENRNMPLMTGFQLEIQDLE
jgi:hypothetical protein